MKILRLSLVPYDGCADADQSEFLEASGYSSSDNAIRDTDASAAVVLFRPDVMIVDTNLREFYGLIMVKSILPIRYVLHIHLGMRDSALPQSARDATTTAETFTYRHLMRSMKTAIGHSNSLN